MTTPFPKLILLSLLCAVATATELEQAIDLFKEHDYAGSRKLLLELIEKEPTKALYWFNLGNTHFAEDSYAEAAEAYGHVVTLKSKLAPAAELYIAK